jgi:hypothetical protein
LKIILTDDIEINPKKERIPHPLARKNGHQEIVSLFKEAKKFEKYST